MKATKTITAISLAVLLAIPLVGAKSAPPDTGPLEIDFETGQVSESDGTPVGSADPSASEGETVEATVLTDGNVAIVTRQSGLPIRSIELPVDSTDPAALKAAQEYQGILPQSMIPTPFTSDGGESKAEGASPTTLLDEDALQLQSISAVTPQAFSYSWNADGDKFEMIRDGETVSTSTLPEFVDADIAPGSTHTYEFVSYDEDGEIIASRTVPVAAPLVGSSRNGALARAATYQQWTSAAIYRTFIPANRVTMDLMTTIGCGQVGQGNNRMFSGDNRSFVLPPQGAPWDSTSSRTSVALAVNWDNPAPYDINWVKAVGPTKLYDGNTLIETRTASDTGIQVVGLGSSSSYANAYVEHVVGNPFCIAGAITYDANFQWWRSGTFQVNGSRYPVPNHEIYGGWDPGTGLVNWWPINFMTNVGFSCLTGACGALSFNDTVSH